MVTEDGILQIFPVTGLITKYQKNFEAEFKFIKNLEYVEGGGSFRTKNSHLLRFEVLSEIKDFIYESLDRFTTEVLVTKQKLIVTQAWCNKNPPHTGHPAHNHPNSIISGVFYFNQNPTLPPLQFFSPRFESPVFEWKAEEMTSTNYQIYFLPLLDGNLVLFPSNIWHAVPLNGGTDTRYSLSFNTFSNELGSEENLTLLKF